MDFAFVLHKTSIVTCPIFRGASANKANTFPNSLQMVLERSNILPLQKSCDYGK